jgi:hypothetical protein
LPSSLAQKLLLQATSLESRIFPSLQTVTTILQQQKISLPKKYQNTKQALDKTQSAQMGMCKMSTHTHTHTHKGDELHKRCEDELSTKKMSFTRDGKMGFHKRWGDNKLHKRWEDGLSQEMGR